MPFYFHPGIPCLHLNNKILSSKVLTNNCVKKFSDAYWNAHYQSGTMGWDVGYVSTPLKNYFDSIKEREIKILIPGAGNAYEVSYLFEKGFRHVNLLDFAPESIVNFKKRQASFPEKQIFCEDFFDHKGSYDLIIEQTFMCSLPPDKRPAYTEKMHQLLKPSGRLLGLLFNHHFEFEGPPYGGTAEEYRKLFEKLFIIEQMEVSKDSIKPRRNRELFFKLLKS